MNPVKQQSVSNDQELQVSAGFSAPAAETLITAPWISVETRRPWAPCERAPAVCCKNEDRIVFSYLSRSSSPGLSAPTELSSPPDVFCVSVLPNLLSREGWVSLLLPPISCSLCFLHSGASHEKSTAALSWAHLYTRMSYSARKRQNNESKLTCLLKLLAGFIIIQKGENISNGFILWASWHVDLCLQQNNVLNVCLLRSPLSCCISYSMGSV